MERTEKWRGTRIHTDKQQHTSSITCDKFRENPSHVSHLSDLGKINQECGATQYHWVISEDGRERRGHEVEVEVEFAAGGAAAVGNPECG
jgi:hypothetical protein